MIDRVQSTPTGNFGILKSFPLIPLITLRRFCYRGAIESPRLPHEQHLVRLGLLSGVVGVDFLVHLAPLRSVEYKQFSPDTIYI